MKRLFDITFVIVIGLVFLIPSLLIAVVVRATSKGPVLYWSDRVGRNNRIFKMPKFRSMFVETPEVATHELKDPARWLTSIGLYLRKSSLDEIPQLWSILLGDMSFVGPRPLLVEYLPLYNEVQQKRHSVKPGITGLAQVNGRNTQTWEQRFLLDLEYVEKQSFALDCRILWLTFIQLLGRGNATEMQVWQGNKNDYTNNN
jgi:O-antigen biosynthesis protein WbqP